MQIQHLKEELILTFKRIIMRKLKLASFYILLIVILPIHTYAQTDSNCYLNSIHVELGGKSLIVGNVSYERELSDKLAIGAGLGFTDKSNVSGWVSGATVEWTSYDFNLPIYGVTRLGKNTKCQSLKHTFIIKYGVRVEAYLRDYKNSSNYDLSIDSEVFPFVSAGWEYSPKQNFFRTELYIFYFGEDALISVLPWIGISYGRKF